MFENNHIKNCKTYNEWIFSVIHNLEGKIVTVDDECKIVMTVKIHPSKLRERILKLTISSLDRPNCEPFIIKSCLFSVIAYIFQFIGSKRGKKICSDILF